MRKKFCPDPSNGGDTGSEESDVENNRDEKEDTRPVDSLSFKNKISADWDPMEGDCSNCKRKCHAHDSDKKDYPAAESVQCEETSKPKEKVRASNYERDSDGLVESDESEERRGVIHESIETTELRNCTSLVKIWRLSEQKTY